jgi:hypothetical protein
MVRIAAKKRTKSVRNSRMPGVCMICWAMFGSGCRIGMPQVTTGIVLLLTRKVLLLAPSVSTGVAVGAATRCSCGLPSATGSPPASATTTVASVARVQVLAGDERSKTCRIRRSGAESVRHGSRSESEFFFTSLRSLSSRFVNLSLEIVVFSVYKTTLL